MSSTEMKKDHLQYQPFIHNDVALGNRKNGNVSQTAGNSIWNNNRQVINSAPIKLKLIFNVAVLSQSF